MSLSSSLTLTKAEELFASGNYRTKGFLRGSLSGKMDQSLVLSPPVLCVLCWPLFWVQATPLSSQ